MTVAYKEKIVQAFRDNAIRSVLLIDDEYYPYEKLVRSHLSLSEKIDQLKSIEEYESEVYKEKMQELFCLNSDLKRSQIAKDFVDFFHDSKRICDVESNTDSLDEERIRKSDLIILDYYLKETSQENRAESSLNLIYELSNNKHMNIVVIYTGEDLSQVWLEIASTLRGSKDMSQIHIENSRSMDKWNENQEDWLGAWDNFVTEDMKSNFLLDNHKIGEITSSFRRFCSDSDIEPVFKDHVLPLLESSINVLNRNHKEFKDIHIHGERAVWLQAGNVFIALCSKRERETPEEVWNCVENALCSWYPSFYRVVTSELQNQIEDANLSMEKSISYSEKDQMAFLWGILQSEDRNKERVTRELLGNIVNEALEGILYNSSFAADVVEIAQAISDPVIPYVERNDDIPGPHKVFQRKILNTSALNVNNETLKPEDLYLIAHAYNEKLSTTKHFHKYVTTGSILKDSASNWYVCVTPSCNTVPNQNTDPGISALKPHRALTLARLIRISDIKVALHNAHHSSYIYITSSDNKKLAFSVLNLETKLPELIKVVIKNHDDETWCDDDGNDYKDMITFETGMNDDDLLEVKQCNEKIYPISLLKPAYAARYQNIQSHYEGRIGVDFITLDLSEPMQPVNQLNKEIILDDY